MTTNIQYLGLEDYSKTWQAMQTFTKERDEHTEDEIWLLEHAEVFTQGLNGKAQHLKKLHPHIPLVNTDRGGQVTYHGPGQLVIYCLLDLKRAGIGVKNLIQRLENTALLTLDQFGIIAKTKQGAPGVYVEERKIASLGLKIKKNKCYHGLALNVDMDLTPFEWIHPCGLKNMQMTQVADFVEISLQDITNAMLEQLKTQLQPEISF